MDKKFCIDCGKELHRLAFYKETKRCHSCVNKITKFKTGLPKCKFCGKQLTNYGIERCLSCAKKEDYKDPTNNPNWQDGKSFEIYPVDFTDELKEQIRKRDNYECQNCSMTEEEHLIVIGRTLHIHHIDYNKENCKKDNLITLCMSCNIRANYNREDWQKYYQHKIVVLESKND